jgi:hypothetical protein
MYERFRPVANKQNWPITHITTGGGGAGLYLSLGHPALSARETTNHFMVFNADRQSLKGKAIRVDGSVIDEFEIRKINGRPSEDYLEQAYPENQLELSFELRPALLGHVLQLPTNGLPTEVSLSIPARKKGKGPAQLEISLDPESQYYYELLTPPLHVKTPSYGATNVVWTKIQARPGVKVIANSSRELRPPLIFRASVNVGKDEVVSPGPSSKLVEPTPQPKK